MPKDSARSGATFNAVQLSLAGKKFEVALATLERDTIGAHFNQRQRDLLVILAAQYEVEMDGGRVDYLVKEKFEQNIAEHLGISAGTIKNDLNAMGDLIHKPFINGGKRDKAYKLTKTGYERFNTYLSGKAQLVLDTGDAIRAAGDEPRSISVVKPIAIIAAACLAFIIAGQVKASEPMLGTNLPNGYLISGHAKHNVMQLADKPRFDAFSTSFNGATVTGASTLTAVMQTGVKAPATEPWEIVSDRKSMFDEHLPKTAC